MNIPYGPILVVEDNPNVRELLEVTLRFKGYPVVSARNGREALSRIEFERPALIITDILMPLMDGYSLVHNLRKNPRTNQIPVIFISATYLTTEDKNFALNLGAVRFVEKPIDPEDFLLTVAEVLTGGTVERTTPISDSEFYRDYRERLESKLQHKATQIARTRRLLETLPPEQKPPFEALLAQEISDHKEIQEELDDLLQLIGNYKPSN